jgi:hypothetical protein
MADVFNQELIVAIITAFAIYLILRGIAIFIGKAGKGYLENKKLQSEKLFLQIIGGYYIISGVLTAFIPTLDWKTEDIYFSIGIYALVSVAFWVGLELLSKRQSSVQEN